MVSKKALKALESQKMERQANVINYNWLFPSLLSLQASLNYQKRPSACFFVNDNGMPKDRLVSSIFHHLSSIKSNTK
jgi:hypothetical protein